MHSLHFDFPSNTFTRAANVHTTIHILHSCNPVLRLYLFFNFQIIQPLHTLYLYQTSELFVYLQYLPDQQPGGNQYRNQFL